MNSISPLAANPTLALASLRAVERAAGELRRGAPVRLAGAHDHFAVLAAETTTEPALEEVLALAAEAGGTALWLLLSARRAADALGHAPETALAAFACHDVTPALLQAACDPTAPQVPPATLARHFTPIRLPADGAAAVQLAKTAQLLPAVLLAGLRPASATPCLLHVGASDILTYPDPGGVRLQRCAEATVPLAEAPDARIIAFRPLDGGAEHLAIVVGTPQAAVAPLVRLHSACFTGDILGSLRCDCGPQLRNALAAMTAEGAGIVLYLAQEGRGIGLINKLRAYTIQDCGHDTVDANLALGWEIDERSFLPAASMLHQLGLTRIRLLTNNPAKIAGLAAHGIAIEQRVPHTTEANGINNGYLETKAHRLGHLL